MTREIVNPMDINKPKVTGKTGDLVATASSDMVAYATDVPRSPVSGEPMIKTMCGSHKGPNFPIWVHIKDRITIPFRNK